MSLPQPGSPEFDDLIRKAKEKAKKVFEKKVYGTHEDVTGLTSQSNMQYVWSDNNNTTHPKEGAWPPKSGTFSSSYLPSKEAEEACKKVAEYMKNHLMQTFYSTALFAQPYEFHARCEMAGHNVQRCSDSQTFTEIGGERVRTYFDVCWTCQKNRLDAIAKRVGSHVERD